MNLINKSINDYNQINYFIFQTFKEGTEDQLEGTAIDEEEEEEEKYS